MQIEIIDRKIDVSELPQAPGCYLMKDADGTVLYVGKAKNLKNRVRSYFDNSPKFQKTIVMVGRARNVELFITENAFEALILENHLIKKYMPQFNVMLKDDKTYPYIKITVGEEYPRIVKTRKVLKDKSRYFGPFPYAATLARMLNVLERVFPLRKCSKMGKKVCLNFHIERCLGPCEKMVSKEEYQAIVESVISLFSGKYEPIVKMLLEKMQQASDEFRFEDAGEFRDLAKGVKDLFERQHVEDAGRHRKEDIIAFETEGEDICFQVFFVRDGKLSGKKHFSFSDIAIPPDGMTDVLSDFISGFYRASEIPDEIITSEPVEDEIIRYFEEKKGKKIVFTVPERGRKRHLLDMVKQNACAYLEITRQKADKKRQILERLKRSLLLERIPHRIEVYDISNISGVSAVGSMIVIIDGEFARKEYRKFKIKTVSGPDDFAMMKEVLSRRLARVESSGWPVPDLMVIDGGKGQLSSACEAVKVQGFEGRFDIVSLAKREEEVFRPDSNAPLTLKPNTELYFFMQRIRDEAHRFAITFFRNVHTKKSIASVLDEIKGIGKKRRSRLLQYFGSVENIKSAEASEIAKVCNISESLATEILEYLKTK